LYNIIIVYGNTIDVDTQYEKGIFLTMVSPNDRRRKKRPLLM